MVSIRISVVEFCYNLANIGQMASRATNSIYTSVSRPNDRISIKDFEIDL